MEKNPIIPLNTNYARGDYTLNDNQQKSKLLHALEFLEEGSDTFLLQLYEKHRQTKDSFLLWNLFIWFPILKVAGLLKVAKLFQNVSTVKKAVVVIGGTTIFGFEVLKWRHYKEVATYVKGFDLSSFDWGLISVVIIILWYFVTLVGLQREVTDPSSKFFLWKAYEKWGHSRHMFAHLIKAFPEEINLFRKMREGLEQEETAESESLLYIQTLIDNHKKFERLSEQRYKKVKYLFNVVSDLNQKLHEVISIYPHIEYHHFNLLDRPYLVYKKQGNELVRKISGQVYPTPHKIKITNEENFIVKVRKADGEVLTGELNGHVLTGCSYKVNGTEYVLAYKMKHNDVYVSKLNILNEFYFQETIKSMFKRVK